MYPVSWLMENQVIFVGEIPVITEAMVIDINDRIIYLLEASPESMVSLVFKTAASPKLPRNIFWLREHLTFVNHPKYGYNITITSNPLLKFIGRTLYKTSGKRIPRFVQTYDEARTLLAQLDPTLPDLPETLPIDVS